MRHLRQIPIFGEVGQKKISEATVGIVGLGGLGCNVITQLASAGIGNFVIADFQTPDETNLNRQFIYSFFGTSDRKTASSEKWIRSISNASVTIVNVKIDNKNVHENLKECDIVVDCTDSDETRLVLSRYAVQTKKPLIYGGVESMFGQASLIIPGITPCLDCFLKASENKDVPSVSAVVSLIASIQAAEVLKYISGTGETLAGKLFTADVSTNVYCVIEIEKNHDCPVCKNI